MLFSSNTHIKRVLHPTVSSSIIYLVNNAREILYEFQKSLARMTGTRKEQIDLQRFEPVTNTDMIEILQKLLEW